MIGAVIVVGVLAVASPFARALLGVLPIGLYRARGAVRGLGIILLALTGTACDSVTSAPQLIVADGQTYAACTGSVWVTDEGSGLLSGPVRLKVSYLDASGASHTLRGVEKLALTALPREVPAPFPQVLPALSGTDRDGKPYQEGQTYLFLRGERAVVRNGRWEPITQPNPLCLSPAEVAARAREIADLAEKDAARIRDEAAARQRAEEETATVSALRLSDLGLASAYPTLIPALTGRVTNNDPDGTTLMRLTVRIRVRECADCVVVGEGTETIRVNVPPGQARDFSQGFYSLPRRAYGTGQWIWWEHEVIAAAGERQS